MAIEKMRLLWLAGSKENIENILLTAFSTRDLHAELAAYVVNEGNGGELLPEDNTFAEYLNRIESIIRSLHIDLQCAFDGVTTFTNEEIEAQLSQVENTYEKINETLMNQSALTKEDKDALIKLRDYNIETLNQTKYTSVNFGRLPISSLAKLPLHEENRYVATVLSKNTHYAWVLYVSLSQNKKEIEKLFESLYFEPIAIPKVDEKQLVYDCKSVLGKLYGYVKHYADVHKFYKYIALFDKTCVITGFVPQRRVKKFKTMFGDMTDVIIQDFPAGLEEGLEPPTVLRNNWFAKPFELFVELYGLPHYGEFDPTFYVALTYSLLFGIMFGDLGQGLVFVIVGYILFRKTKGNLWGIVQRLGFFSMFFGTIYGSVFGNETLLNPFFKVLGFAEKPIEIMRSTFTNQLLLMAVGLGAVLILTSMTINIVLQFKRKNVGDALFSQNGLAGVVFYGSLIIGAALQLGLGIKVANPITIVLFIVVPLVAILFRVPLKNLVRKMRVTPHEGWGGYMSESFFELFEVLLSFMSNTMSFLRVGGFVLSHAGMMLVVMNLTALTGKFGIITMIFGNIFVIGLEGLIVGIQTLRLEFYEMFSRYFEGGGKKYIPTTLQNLT